MLSRQMKEEKPITVETFGELEQIDNTFDEEKEGTSVQRLWSDVFSSRPATRSPEELRVWHFGVYKAFFKRKLGSK